MKRKTTTLLILSLVMAVSFRLTGITSTSAQADWVGDKIGDDVKPELRMVYHNGTIMTGASDVYVIWYGCWDDNCGTAGDTASQDLLERFVQSIGGSPYFQINTTYSDFRDLTPSSGLFFGGSVIDHYSHGVELTEWDIAGNHRRANR